VTITIPEVPGTDSRELVAWRGDVKLAVLLGIHGVWRYL